MTVGPSTADGSRSVAPDSGVDYDFEIRAASPYQTPVASSGSGSGNQSSHRCHYRRYDTLGNDFPTSETRPINGLGLRKAKEKADKEDKRALFTLALSRTICQPINNPAYPGSPRTSDGNSTATTRGTTNQGPRPAMTLPPRTPQRVLHKNGIPPAVLSTLTQATTPST
ncbi:hypothetical protein EVAR_64522_1 [Eumeta japonica]|uniref:Uncharacterized protein n=1 Tax=Eumeta variegata TaxID=151549 RepID=A0A4C1ZJP7_EUMVA|nr:hypothetical protein EVAR_64522_1 [Eumeta japonica]